MNNPIFLTVVGVVAGALIACPVHAADTYQASLKAGDENREADKADAALADYKTAESQASNNTERALALSKQAYIHAYDKRDYAAARSAAEKALAIWLQIRDVHKEQLWAIGVAGLGPAPYVVKSNLHNFPSGLIDANVFRNLGLARPQQFFFK